MRKCKDAGCWWRSVQTRRQAMSLRQGNLMPEACTFWRNDAALRRDSITTLYGWIEDYILFMLGTLISDLGSPDPLVRVEAPTRLGDLGAAAKRAIPSLLSLTEDESQHPLLRLLAASAVSRINPAQTGAVIPVLINALKSDDAPLQGAAADELGALGKHAEPALPALSRLLGVIAPPRGLPPLKRSGGSQETECLRGKWDVRFSGARTGWTAR